MLNRLLRAVLLLMPVVLAQLAWSIPCGPTPGPFPRSIEATERASTYTLTLPDMNTFAARPWIITTPSRCEPSAWVTPATITGRLRALLKDSVGPEYGPQVTASAISRLVRMNTEAHILRSRVSSTRSMWATLRRWDPISLRALLLPASATVTTFLIFIPVPH